MNNHEKELKNVLRRIAAGSTPYWFNIPTIAAYTLGYIMRLEDELAFYKEGKVKR